LLLQNNKNILNQNEQGQREQSFLVSMKNKEAFHETKDCQKNKRQYDIFQLRIFIAIFIFLQNVLNHRIQSCEFKS
jgi:hypothetical protein